jgi:hypothetical protein
MTLARAGMMPFLERIPLIELSEEDWKPWISPYLTGSNKDREVKERLQNWYHHTTNFQVVLTYILLNEPFPRSISNYLVNTHFSLEIGNTWNFRHLDLKNCENDEIWLRFYFQKLDYGYKKFTKAFFERFHSSMFKTLFVERKEKAIILLRHLELFGNLELFLEYGPSDEITSEALKNCYRKCHGRADIKQLFMGNLRGENEQQISAYIFDAMDLSSVKHDLNNGFYYNLSDCLFRCITAKAWKRFGGVRKFLEIVEHPSYRKHYLTSLEKSVKEIMQTFSEVGMYKDIAMISMMYVVNCKEVINEFM